MIRDYSEFKKLEEREKFKDKEILLLTSKFHELDSQLKLLSDQFHRLYNLFIEDKKPKHQCKICERIHDGR